MKTASFKKEYDSTAIKGKATLTESQINSLTFSPSIRVREDLIYVIPEQWVFDEKLPQRFNGYDTSKKVFAFGINSAGEAVCATTLSISGLRFTHYGLVSDNKNPLISALENTNKVFRAISGTPTYSIFRDGKTFMPKVDGSNAYIDKPFVFRKAGKGQQCWVAAGKRLKNGQWQMDTKVVDGMTYLSLYTSWAADYEVLDKVFDYNWKELCEDLITDGLPE